MDKLLVVFRVIGHNFLPMPWEVSSGSLFYKNLKFGVLYNNRWSNFTMTPQNGVAKKLETCRAEFWMHPHVVQRLTRHVDSYQPFINKRFLYKVLRIYVFDWCLLFSWKYSSASELNGLDYSGLIATYSAGGYYLDLEPSLKSSNDSIRKLKENLWLDKGTRGVFIEFTLYNANVNLFCIIK